jgi:cold shock CspA family protein
VATGTVSGLMQLRDLEYSARLCGKDVFVHISEAEKAGFSGLAEGAKVSYEVVANRGRESAENLKIG